MFAFKTTTAITLVAGVAFSALALFAGTAAANDDGKTPSFLAEQTDFSAPPPPAKADFQAPADNRVAPASRPLPDLGEADMETLKKIAAKQTAIQLKELELKEKTLDAKIAAADDKITKFSAAEEEADILGESGGSVSAIPQPAPAVSVQPMPLDDTSLLPTIVSVTGAGERMQAELQYPGGYKLNAKPGDQLPGGFEVKGVAPKSVTVASTSTGNEYALTYGNPGQASPFGGSMGSSAMPAMSGTAGISTMPGFPQLPSARN